MTKPIREDWFDEFAPVSSLASILKRYCRDNQVTLKQAMEAAINAGFDKELAEDAAALATKA